MIYMRDRTGRKKGGEGQDLAKRLIIDELKYKISQARPSLPNYHQKERPGRKGEDDKNDKNDKKEQPKASFQVFQKDPAKRRGKAAAEQIQCESIVVDEGQSIIGADFYSPSRKDLSVEKCFDIQIVNMLGSRTKLEAFIKMVEHENSELKHKVQIMGLKHADLERQAEESSQGRIADLQFRCLQESINNSQKQSMINRYQRCFEEGKHVLLNASLELIEAKNTLGVSFSAPRVKEKHSQLSKCLQKSERMISVYSHFLQEIPKATQKQGIILEQLISIVKYQERTIEKLAQSRPKDGGLHRENVLLRYQASRLSNQNQELIALLSEAKSSHNQNKWQPLHNNTERAAPSQPQEQLQSFSQTEEQEQTPIARLTVLDQTPRRRDMVEECSHYEDQELCSSHLTEKESLIKNLEVEKEYISDQLISLEKDLEQLQKAYKLVHEQKEKAVSEVQLLKMENERLDRDLEVSEQQQNVLNDQIGLLKQKIRQLEEKGDTTFRGSHPAMSRYVELPETGPTVTIEDLLKFFKKKELTKFHQALLDLINRYEQRISELNACYKEEKEMKDRLLGYSRGLYSTVTSGRSLSLQNIVLEISKYQEIVSLLNENEIDALLRQIRGYSIGIDHNEFQNIRSELEDYVYHLKARLPALSQQYFEDGSSVADSLMGSSQRSV